MRLVLAEDQALLRGALIQLLQLEHDISVVGDASDGAQALKLVRELQGVRRYLLKEMPVERLAAALRDVRAGARVIAPKLALHAWAGESYPLIERECECAAQLFERSHRQTQY